MKYYKTNGKLILWLTGIVFLVCSCKPAPDKTEVKIRMADGIELSTSIFVPKGPGKFPAVLVRTPYGKWSEDWLGSAFGRKGIAVVIQDIRGKYGSGGNFYPFRNERSDGLQTLRWIRNQSWSNGIVSGWGASYVGYTQWAISDSLNFLAPVIAGANIYDFVYPDGLFSLQSAFVWGFNNASHETNLITPEKSESGFKILPLSVADDSTIQDIPFITDWLTHETEDEYWKEMNHRGITLAPVLSIAGWYDIFLKAQIRDFQALDSPGNHDNRMIIGPFCHGSQGEENKYGGIRKTGNPLKIFRFMLNNLTGKKNILTSPLKDKKYNLFIMERNEYIGSDVWPPNETKTVPYYIGPVNYFNVEKFSRNGFLSYDYNPLDPYRSHGGTALGDGVGPAMQNDNIPRPDQLSFETNVLEKPLILLGPVSATLWLSSDVSCTDFIVCLQDVFPDGKIINIQEGGAEVQFDEGNPSRYEISVWATGYQVSHMHKLKVVITSSWFPRFNRSLNNCLPIADAINPVIARQKVYYGPGTPSCINLPVFKPDQDQ